MRHRCNPKVLSAYLDRELPAPEREALARHLEVCGHCREELAALQRVQGLFEGWAPPPPRPFFEARLNRQLNGAAQRRAWRKWARLVPATLAVVSIGALLFLADQLAVGPEPMTVESYLNRSLDREVLEIATLTESGLSKDRVLDLVIASEGR
jgi:anti-sigma factor RsiW